MQLEQKVMILLKLAMIMEENKYYPCRLETESPSLTRFQTRQDGEINQFSEESQKHTQYPKEHCIARFWTSTIGEKTGIRAHEAQILHNQHLSEKGINTLVRYSF